MFFFFFSISIVFSCIIYVSDVSKFMSSVVFISEFNIFYNKKKIAVITGSMFFILFNKYVKYAEYIK